MRISCFLLFTLTVASAETFPAANGLERTLVVQQPHIQNPVAVSVDVDGTIYAVETARRKAADLAIDEFYNFGWLPHDLSHTSIEQKQAFFREQLDGKNKFEGTSLKDHNGDGSIDVRDLTALSEKIIRITDKDNDGIYDTSNTFAEDFNTEVTGTAAGTLAWRGDVYATIAPDLWTLRDTTGDGKADKRESLAHGFGVHIAISGHDMHGLTLGPDGRIYWSIGDKGTNVTSQEGENFFAPHEGALLRCFPDGSEFEIFARGLRNAKEIAFDKYGNLFSVDNDSDNKGERERFVHITEGSDTGWRSYYQYRKSDYNPWLAESIWKTSGELQPAYITPTNSHYTDGPAGFAYNPGTALNEKYRDSFFVSEFSAGNLKSFKVKPKGASYEIASEHTILSGPMIVGINFGPDGALYCADWSGGYPLNEKGAIWKLDDPSVAGTTIRQQVAEMLKASPSETPVPDLLKLLSHPDMRIRLDAQWELANRATDRESSARPKSQVKTGLITTASADDSDEIAVIHSLWALTQLKSFEPSLFEKLSNSKNPELRAQAAKHAAESATHPVPTLTKMLSDESPRVRFQAATAIWKLGMKDSLDAVITMLAENDDKDPYLRHAGALALTVSTPEELAETAMNHKSASVRLAAAVACRRMSSSHTWKLLIDEDPRVVDEAARAIFDEPAITDRYPDLASLIGLFDRLEHPGFEPNLRIPAARRSIAANRYLADGKSAIRLAKFAADDRVDPSLRLAALEALSSWTEASELNPVDGRYDPLKPADPAFAKAAYFYLDGVQNSEEKTIANAAQRLFEKLGILADSKGLEETVLDLKADPAARIRALDSLNVADLSATAKILPGLLADKSPALRTRAAYLISKRNPAAAIAYARSAITESKDIPERQQAVLLLAKMNDSASISFLKERSAIPDKDPAILLELNESLPETNFETDRVALIGGDAALGEKIFNEHLAARCIGCHRIGEVGSDVGPALTEVGKKGREHILESLVNPQAKLAPGFGMMSVTKNDKTSLAGALKEENETALTLILPGKTEATIKLSEIASRTEPFSTMPPMAGILSPREIRDVVEFLSGLK